MTVPDEAAPKSPLQVLNERIRGYATDDDQGDQKDDDQGDVEPDMNALIRRNAIPDHFFGGKASA